MIERPRVQPGRPSRREQERCFSCSILYRLKRSQLIFLYGLIFSVCHGPCSAAALECHVPAELGVGGTVGADLGVLVASKYEGTPKLRCARAPMIRCPRSRL